MGYITDDEVIGAWDPAQTIPAAADINASIDLFSKFIDRVTRQWFEPRTLTVYLDGNGGNTIYLPVPVISITSMYTNSDFTNALETTEYAVYSDVGFEDDRRNPRISLVSEDSDFFARVANDNLNHYPGPTFWKGRRNIKLVGSFGFVEPGTPPTTPVMIKRACMKLVLRDLKNPVGNAGSSSAISRIVAPVPVGPILMESTDHHQIMYSNPKVGSLRAGSVAITGDSEVDAILALYKGPMLLGVSSRR
jgi:hypothetical protein